MTRLDIVTFGYGHNQPLTETPDLIVDLRGLFRDPLRDEKLRELDGRHPDVIAYVRRTVGFNDYIRSLYDALCPLRNLTSGSVLVAIGCGGGRHRAVVAGANLHEMAGLHGWAGMLVNRDINRPLLPMPADKGRYDQNNLRGPVPASGVPDPYGPTYIPEDR